MRAAIAWIVLAVSVAGCASHMEAPPVAASTRNQQPPWRQQMDIARRLAADGSNYVLAVRPLKVEASGSAGIYVFYNNPRPFCYTYMIPGEWVAAGEPNAYRSKDGRAFAGVSFRLASYFEGFEGATLVERAGKLISLEYEKALGQRLTGVEVVPFESARPGTWKWKAATKTKADRQIDFGTKVIVDLSPLEAVAQLTVAGTPDDDGMARRIIQTVRTTSDPECYWPVLEHMLKNVFGDR